MVVKIAVWPYPKSSHNICSCASAPQPLKAGPSARAPMITWPPPTPFSSRCWPSMVPPRVNVSTSTRAHLNPNPNPHLSAGLIAASVAARSGVLRPAYPDGMCEAGRRRARQPTSPTAQPTSPTAKPTSPFSRPLTPHLHSGWLAGLGNFTRRGTPGACALSPRAPPRHASPFSRSAALVLAAL